MSVSTLLLFDKYTCRKSSEMANRRRNSYVEIAVNPFESGIKNEQKLELVSDSVSISSELFEELLTVLRSLSCSNNSNRYNNSHPISLFVKYSISDSSEIVKYLSDHKNGFLFSSHELIQILDLIPSKRTQIAIIEMIGPRLTDPKKGSSELVERFRYAEEKKIVQDILKARAVTQNSNIYASKKPNAGQNLPKRRQNRPNTPTNPNPVAITSPPVEIILSSAPSLSAPPQLQEPPCRIDCQNTSRPPQDFCSSNNQKRESSNFGDMDSVDYSPTTTNEDLDQIIAEKEETQFSPRPSHELVLPVDKEKVPVKESSTALPTIVDSSTSDPEEKSSHTIPTPPHTVTVASVAGSDHFFLEPPVIEVVGTKTRVLSVHQSQPASKIGSEVEFLTHTDEFSFDERFQDSKVDSSQSHPNPPSIPHIPSLLHHRSDLHSHSHPHPQIKQMLLKVFAKGFLLDGNNLLFFRVVVC
jgi:hypothetical protein